MSSLSSSSELRSKSVDFLYVDFKPLKSHLFVDFILGVGQIYGIYGADGSLAERSIPWKVYPIIEFIVQGRNLLGNAPSQYSPMNGIQHLYRNPFRVSHPEDLPVWHLFQPMMISLKSCLWIYSSMMS